MSQFYPIKPQVVPSIEWYANFKAPTFRTVEVVNLSVRDTDTVIHKNSSGQVDNKARALGTDNVNASGIKSSLLSRGLDVSCTPIIILEDGTLLDGFTRQSVLLDIKQEKWIYLVVRLREGYTIEDAYDEVGLGANDHLQCKPATIQDFKKRLSAWIRRQDEFPTRNQCIAWFNDIPNSFDMKKIEDAVDKVISAEMSSITMESFNAKTAASTGAVALNRSGQKVFAINNSNSTYFERAVSAMLIHYDETGQLAPAIGFLDKVSSEDADTARSAVRKKVARINRAIAKLVVEYQKDPEFVFMNLEGFVGQRIGIEEPNQLY